ncbi:MAG: methyltransferase [Planctomycetes bacterium]|nr:methyltransferase [Planctomycetota bacterium]
MEPVRIQLGGTREQHHQKEEPFLNGRLRIASSRGVTGADRALVAALGEPLEGRVLAVATREGVAALAAHKLHGAAEVCFFTMDAYDLHRARATFHRNGAQALRSRVGADLPEPGTFDWVLLPVSRTGDAMLNAELVLEAHGALKDRGKVLAATDNPRDSWLHGRILDAFGSATIHGRGPLGTVYIARKRSDRPPRERSFARTFEARVFGRALRLETRPGVFSHGELDEGTLALSEVAPIEEGSRAVDLGCGSGALGIGAALAAPRGLAVLVDSNARAARVARANALANGAERNALILLAHDLASLREQAFDVVLANPPYFADHRITELFAWEARRVLAPGGKLHLVTKAPERPVAILEGIFGGCEAARRRSYAVITASKRPA